jgi:hypothetical protein
MQWIVRCVAPAMHPDHPAWPWEQQKFKPMRTNLAYVSIRWVVWCHGVVPAVVGSVAKSNTTSREAAPALLQHSQGVVRCHGVAPAVAGARRPWPTATRLAERLHQRLYNIHKESSDAMAWHLPSPAPGIGTVQQHKQSLQWWSQALALSPLTGTSSDRLIALLTDVACKNQSRCTLLANSLLGTVLNQGCPGWNRSSQSWRYGRPYMCRYLARTTYVYGSVLLRFRAGIQGAAS